MSCQSDMLGTTPKGALVYDHYTVDPYLTLCSPLFFGGSLGFGFPCRRRCRGASSSWSFDGPAGQVLGWSLREGDGRPPYILCKLFILVYYKNSTEQCNTPTWHAPPNCSRQRQSLCNWRKAVELPVVSRASHARGTDISYSYMEGYCMERVQKLIQSKIISGYCREMVPVHKLIQSKIIF